MAKSKVNKGRAKILRKAKKEQTYDYLAGDYGLGSWLKDNVGNIAQTIGGGILVGTGIGTAAGVGMLAGGVSGFAADATGNKQEKLQEEQQHTANSVNQKQAMSSIGQGRLAQYNANQQAMIPTFANGGSMVDYGLGSYRMKDIWPKMAKGGHLPEGNSTLKEAKEFAKLYPDEFNAGTEVEYEHTGNKKLAMRIAADHIKDSIKINQGGAPDYYKKLQAIGISDELNKMPQVMAEGGYFQSGNMSGSIGDVPSMANINPVTNYKGGGTHQQNRLGGIPVGKARVEEGEVRVDLKEGSYIFSNRY